MKASRAHVVKSSRSGNPGALLIRAQREHLKELRALIRNRAGEEEVVHQVRTGIKRLRAGWRLLRPGFPESITLGERRRLRTAGHGLTDVREDAVLADTLEKLRERASDEDEYLLMATALKTFLARRPRKGNEMEESGTHSGNSLSEKPWLAALPILSASLRRMEGLTVERLDWNRLRPNLEQSYRKARNKYRNADPDRDESFHEWRKRSKDLWYQLKALAPELPAAGKISDRLEALQDRLGDAHDLSVLADRISRRPGDFGGNGNPAVMAALRKSIISENRKMKRKSLRLGRRIFGPKPEKFMGKLNLPEEQDLSASAPASWG